MSDNKTLSILLIEDNGMFLSLAGEMLSEHNVTPARTAKEGMEQFKKISPDIIFLDIALPDGSGHDLLKEIKALNKNAYVIMLTASRLRDDVIKSMEEGAEGYIIKPFSSDMIHQCLKEYHQSQSKGKKKKK